MAKEKKLEFRPADYYEAAQERYAQCQTALEQQEYGLSIMLAGVAAECMIRSQRNSKEWQSRHNLQKLAVEAEFYPSAKKVDALIAVTGAINTLQVIWRNNYRYADETKIKSFLMQLDRYEFHKVKGERGPLKRAAKEALEAVRIIMIHGGNRWASAKK